MDTSIEDRQVNLIILNENANYQTLIKVRIAFSMQFCN
jgi:hypothetical protein